MTVLDARMSSVPPPCALEFPFMKLMFLSTTLFASMKNALAESFPFIVWPFPLIVSCFLIAIPSNVMPESYSQSSINMISLPSSALLISFDKSENVFELTFVLFTISSLFAVDIAMSSSLPVKTSLSVMFFPSMSAAQAYDMDTRKIMTSNGMSFIDFFIVFPSYFG